MADLRLEEVKVLGSFAQDDWARQLCQLGQDVQQAVIYGEALSSHLQGILSSTISPDVMTRHEYFELLRNYPSCNCELAQECGEALNDPRLALDQRNQSIYNNYVQELNELRENISIYTFQLSELLAYCCGTARRQSYGPVYLNDVHELHAAIVNQLRKLWAVFSAFLGPSPHPWVF